MALPASSVTPPVPVTKSGVEFGDLFANSGIFFEQPGNNALAGFGLVEFGCFRQVIVRAEGKNSVHIRGFIQEIEQGTVLRFRNGHFARAGRKKRVIEGEVLVERNATGAVFVELTVFIVINPFRNQHVLAHFALCRVGFD